MTTVVLLGGNGFIGRAVAEQWLRREPQADIYVVSRSGLNKIKDGRIHNIAADATDYDAIVSRLPDRIDYIVDFVGRPVKDAASQEKANRLPAETMRTIAEKYEVKAMGFIGGILGPKSFTTIKADIISELRKSRIRVEAVEPTLVYGGDRKDLLSKLVPIFKALGVLSKRLRPVPVTEVAEELIDRMIRTE